jgi:energy-coupling factor transporter transmembrane protein EcfT
MISAGAIAYHAGGAPSRLDALDPRCRVVGAAALALAISSVRGASALATVSLLPAMFVFVDGRKGVSPLLKTLASINKISALVWILLPFTYPGHRFLGVFSLQGLEMAFAITWKMNMISIAMARLVASMGVGGIDGALCGLRVPLKLRMLLILSVRYVFLLSDRVAAMTKAICARAPKLGAMATLRVMACMIGTTLIHCSDKAERSAKALRARGGIDGFRPRGNRRWALRDSVFCAAFFVYLASVAIIDAICAL